MLKKIGIGCGGLIAIVVVIIVVSAIASGGGDGDSSSESEAPPPLVNATQVWRDYETNETRANTLYKDTWLRVRLDNISKIESDGRVVLDMDTSGWSHISLDFKNDEDVLNLNPGQGITAVCRLSGFELDTWLNFNDCRWP